VFFRINRGEELLNKNAIRDKVKRDRIKKIVYIALRQFFTAINNDTVLVSNGI
jgi:hypothetical protein